MTDADVPARPWVAHKPEARLSIAFDRFLDRALLPPCYYSAAHDADGGGRSDLQRARDRARGIKPGCLDWEVWQGPHGLARRVELKRGHNKPTVHQLTTIAALTDCGAAPIVAWSLFEACHGLSNAGFRFAPNVVTILQHCEELLAGWDREAEAVLSGAVVRKPASGKKRQTRVSPSQIARFERARRLP